MQTNLESKRAERCRDRPLEMAAHQSDRPACRLRRLGKHQQKSVTRVLDDAAAHSKKITLDPLPMGLLDRPHIRLVTLVNVTTRQERLESRRLNEVGEDDSDELRRHSLFRPASRA